MMLLLKSSSYSQFIYLNEVTFTQKNDTLGNQSENIDWFGGS